MLTTLASRRFFNSAGNIVLLLFGTLSLTGIALARSAKPSAKTYALQLLTPASELISGKPIALSFLLKEGTEPNAKSLSFPPEIVKASLSMPSMAGMAVEATKAQTGSEPGAYTVTATFPHPGNYQLIVIARPRNEPAGSASLTFEVGEGGAASGDMQMGPGHDKGMEGMHGHSLHGEGMEGMMSPEAMREASGTAWQPESTPMHGFHSRSGPWSTMTHYNVLVNYDRQTGPRGDTDVNSVNWGMLMAQRPAGDGTLMLRAMVSLEPLTIGGFGYPLLFQTGESWRGKPLVDRQHPHDLFMELAAKYQRPLGGDLKGFLYAGLPGEPALGPVAFPHRLSSFSNPMAPISHHWQDATHITFGVLTAGVTGSNWQAEASSFKGREPDENRYDIDTPKLDSYSGRFTLNPNANWSLSASHGFIRSPEALHPSESFHRAVVSAMFNRLLPEGGNWATTAVWGRNQSNEHGATDSWLLETSLDLKGWNTLFGRWESVQKTGDEILAGLPDEKYRLNALTLGGEHNLTPGKTHQVSIGGALTFYSESSGLRPVYGRHPRGYWVFLHVHPRGMTMKM